MGQRGPKPKPTALRLLQGNPGHRPLNNSEPKPVSASLLPPTRLEGEEVTIWKELAPRLSALGLLTELDREALSMLCALSADFWTAHIALKQVKPIRESKRARPSEDALHALLRQTKGASFDRLLKLAAKFGMTPSDRTSLVAPDSRDDDIRAFLFGRNVG